MRRANLPRFSTCGINYGVTPATDTPLVDLLGPSRARVMDLLRSSPRSVAQLATEMGLSQVAVRHHLRLLRDDGLVRAETVRRNRPGRPGACYTVTDKGRRLFPDGSADLANELLDFVEVEYGRPTLLRFMRWRQQRQEERYAAALDADADPAARAEALARLLSEDGFLSSVRPVTAPDGARVLELRQDHCAIKHVADEHPEVCAYEAALFRRVLGVKVSRRQTMAGGATSCVCHIRPPAQDAGTTSLDNPMTGAGDGNQG
ncbi:hypothetical protein BH20ACT9_BH20ACT9_09490 [soil metagenome]